MKDVLRSGILDTKQMHLCFSPRELTLFWSKLLMRLESSAEAFLGRSKEMALLCRSVCHILFLIKVIQNEVRPFQLTNSPLLVKRQPTLIKTT